MRNLWLILLLLLSSSCLASPSYDLLIEKLSMFTARFSEAELTWLILLGIATLYFTIYRFDRFAITYGPEVLTTAGILGCFTVIAFSLLQFDSNNITHSVPVLLEGITTAFYSSVVGIFGALLIRLRHKWGKDPKVSDEEALKAATLEDLLREMIRLRKSIASTEEQHSLSNQIKLMRQESGDQRRSLESAFNQFAKHMTANNQKAIVEALSQVIKDFNENLTEQFGENFKHLNESVKELVTWQKQYKTELNDIKAYQSQSAQDMQTAADNFNALLKEATEFKNIALSLQTLMKNMDEQKATLIKQELALNEVFLTMKNTLPDFSEHTKNFMIQITEGIKNIEAKTKRAFADYEAQNKENSKAMQDTLSAFADQAKDKIVGNVDETYQNIRESIFAIQEESSKAVEEQIHQLKSTQNQMSTTLSNTLKQNQEVLSTTLKENSKILKEGVLALDKELEKSLNDSLTALGKQLASLSEKFVNDYQPLTEKLRQIVKLASSIEA